MLKSDVFQGNSLIGKVEIHPQNSYSGSWIREIRIAHFSPPSDRCPPLAVLHTISPGGARFKMESLPSGEPSRLFSMHATCLRDQKTAVVPLGEEELHLVAMPSRKNAAHYSCFWGFCVTPGLYNSCLVMLNLRCLGIVFDLDETLIVANTMRSFEDRIDALQRKINNETDPQRAAGMLSEIKRYQEDKSILKQYIDHDQVVDNGKLFTVQAEIVPPLSDSHQLISRPIIRLQEKNIILTRVNPAIRDTSVLVQLRPAWEDLRSYLTARGRKRFEVYVCTMAERDYALEMWRLLDPESNLISSRELLDRIVCVKSGSRKSLLNVFQDGICHPRMSLVIDDRLKVWEEKDQPRVHVVPAFAPYYAPQAEVNNTIPVLCVARNVACNVRGGFFKEFDEGLLPRINTATYEDEVTDFPTVPDVGNYLISEEDPSASNGNGNKDPLCFEGMVDAEVERRLKDINFGLQALPMATGNLDPRTISSIQQILTNSGALSLPTSQLMIPLPNNNQSVHPIALARSVGQPISSEPRLQSSPAREEGEVPESELDPDTRRRLLILHHGQDSREPPPAAPLPPPPPPPPFIARPQVTAPPVQAHQAWVALDEERSPRQMGRLPKKLPLEHDSGRFGKKRSHYTSAFHGEDHSGVSDRFHYEKQRFPLQLHHKDDQMRSSHGMPNHSSSGVEMSVGRTPSNRGAHLESSSIIMQNPENSVDALQEIAMKCGTKVEYRTNLSDTTELRFSLEVWLVGEKIGEGIGGTRKQALQQAAESSLQYLANKYLTNALPDDIAVHGDMTKSLAKANGLNVFNGFEAHSLSGDEILPVPGALHDSRLQGEGTNVCPPSVAELKELCTTEGYSLVFQAQPPISDEKGNMYAQVEIGGQIFGKGTGTTWEEAKLQATEEALGTFKSMVGQFSQKHSNPSRMPATVPSPPAAPNKRFKEDFRRPLQRISSSRYSKNDAHVH